MSWVKIFLWINAILFVGYGAACLVSPALPARSAGFDLGTASGTVEIVAMYGGLQIGVGLLVLQGALRPERQEAALLAMAFVLGSLCLARLVGISLHGASAYNLGAAGYEATASVLSIVALRGRRVREAAA